MHGLKMGRLAVLLLAATQVGACRRGPSTETGAPSASASASTEGGRPAEEADFSRVTHEQLQAALRASGATVTDEARAQAARLIEA